MSSISAKTPEMTKRSTVQHDVAALPDVAALLETAAQYVSGVGRLRVDPHLRATFRRVVACEWGLNLGSVHGQRRVDAVFSDMIAALASWLVSQRQREYPNPELTVEDWLSGLTLADVQASIAAAAIWHRSSGPARANSSTEE